MKEYRDVQWWCYLRNSNGFDHKVPARVEHISKWLSLIHTHESKRCYLRRSTRFSCTVLALEVIKDYRSYVHEVLYNGLPAVSKIAAFDWQISSMERETWGYSVVDRHQRPDLGEPRIAPRVLGHLTECGRVMGILLERLEGNFASVEDLPERANTLRRLHEIGLVHGDVNRYNFIVDKQSGKVKMVDFEHVAALDVDEAAAGLELESLASELTEETGRGGSVILSQAASVLVIH
jgi:hypothetical protein